MADDQPMVSDPGGTESTTMPADAVLTVATREKEIPLLFSELVCGQQILEHESVVPLRSIPTLEHDVELQTMIFPQPDRTVESDPNIMDDSDHILLPLAQRSAYREDAESNMGDTWTTELQKSLDQSSVAAEAQTRDHSLVCKLDNLGTIVPCAMITDENDIILSPPSSSEFTQLESTVTGPNGPIPSAVGRIPDNGFNLSFVRRFHDATNCLPILLLLQYSTTYWMSELVHDTFPSPSIHHTSLTYFTALTLSQYLDTDTPLWSQIMFWLTNSTRVDLVRRLLLYGSDIKQVQAINAEMPDRATEIINSGHYLTNLIGGVSNFIGDIKNQGLFLHEHENFLPRWRKVSMAFKKVNEGMKENKYHPSSDDPTFRTHDNPVGIFKDTSTSFTWSGFVYNIALMPLPAISILIPQFRRGPFIWCVIANELTISLHTYDVTLTAMLKESNEGLFSEVLLTSKAIQLYGLYQEIAAASVNKIWRSRRQAGVESSFTYFDADYQIESVQNEEARPLPIYHTDPSTYANRTMENIVWLISSNKDQALNLLHQVIQGLHYGACPRMASILATVSDVAWDFSTLVQNTICSFCNRELLNKWYSCNRRAAMVNVHPGLTSYQRQHYYVVNIFAKYLSGTTNGVRYQGHPGARSRKLTYRFTDMSLPKSYQIKEYISHGNECLVGADGHGVGTHIVLNSGCMSHSTPLTPNGGLSKSMMMSFVLMVAPLEYEKQMNFGKAYYLVDISDLEDRHIEVVTILQRACKRFFWIFETVDSTEHFAKVWPGSRSYMVGSMSTLEKDLIIMWDEMNHAIRDLLNAHNIVDPTHPVAKYNRPKLAIEEYLPAPDVTLANDSTDSHPNMAPTGEYFSKVTLHKLTEEEEGIHYAHLRNSFKHNFRFEFCHCHSKCKWDKLMVKALITIWEFAQTYNLCRKYTGEFGFKRNFFYLTDFRITTHTLLQLTNRYMTPTTKPFPGFQLRREYRHFISEFPVNSGRDDNGRPHDFILASLYLGVGHPAWSEGYIHCDQAECYPGYRNPARGYDY